MRGLAGPSTNRAWNEQCLFPDCPGDDSSVAQAAWNAERQFGNACATLAPLYSLGDFCYAVTREVIDRLGAAEEAFEDGPCWEMDYNIRAARAGFDGVWVKSAFVWRAPVTPRRREAEKRRFELSKQLYQRKFCGLHLAGRARSYHAHCQGDACSQFAPKDLIATQITFEARSVARITPVKHRPLVSCIMPTSNRRAFVPDAIAAFFSQDYAPRELIVLDDGTESIADLIPADSRIRYLRSSERRTVGAKRNAACELARGDIIVHWDDDDWHADWRISYQVEELLAANKQICGLDQLWYLDPKDSRAWRYRYISGRQPWIAGGTFCYRKETWQRRRFQDVQVGEDNCFIWSLEPSDVLCLTRDDFFVARCHSANASKKRPQPPCWQPIAAELVRAIIDRHRIKHGTDPFPHISCIMPTADRAPFVALALRRFVEQDYPNKELIVIDDGTQPIQALFAEHEMVRYVHLPARKTIGEKRNLACSLAQGEVIAQWDDDDWYGTSRLSRQLQPLLEDTADITGLRCRWLATLPDGAFWQMSAALHRRMFVHDVHGGTLMFRKRLWNEGLRYPAANLAEDAALLRDAVQRGARLRVVENDGDFVYFRHGKNAWRFDVGRAVDSRQWQLGDRPPQLDETTFRNYCEALQHLPSPASTGDLAG
jgi:glycosyltransferase involved in cell wall biosynthesis